MKKLLTLMAALMALVYLMPMVTVGFGGPGGDIAPPEGAVLAGGTAPAGAEAETDPHPSRQDGADSPAEGVRPGYDQKTFVTVRIDGQAQTLRLHDYLVGVVAAEMPASFPAEALKAQALAARTYTLYKIKLYQDGMDIPESHNGAQLCDDSTHCKAYCDVAAAASTLWGNAAQDYLACVTQAVTETDGLIAVYDGQPIAAVFHAASGDYTEAAVDVWGSAVDYLQSVPSQGGAESARFNGSVRVGQAEFAAAVRAAYPEAVFPDDPAHWFKASSRSQAGGVIDVAVGGVRVPGTFIRRIAGLNSTNFRVRVEGDDFVFTTEGYGHGVGMSQYGARALALEGARYDQIIKHYFTGVELLVKG